MSRTNHKSKGPGYEYWGRRSVGGKELRNPNGFTKKHTHRKERRQGKQQVKFSVH